MNSEIRHLPSVLVQEAASLFHLLGGMGAKHLVIVGGLVPPLLLPEVSESHIGSVDIDLCLSVAIPILFYFARFLGRGYDILQLWAPSLSMTGNTRRS